MDQEYLYTKLKSQEQSLQSLLDDLYTSTMEKVDELIEDARKIKKKNTLNMKSRSKINLLMANLRLALCNWLLSKAMDKDDTLTDKEYNSIREAHDYISNARDILERLTKQDL